MHTWTEPNGDRWNLWTDDTELLTAATGHEVAEFLCHGHSRAEDCEKGH
jgi:hypothetical protein